MKVIIAEKPSLARNIASGIGEFKRKDGYLEGKDYYITWAFGHLFSLYDIEQYSNDSNTKWRLDNIPCFPTTFKFGLKKDKDKKVDEGVLKQFKIISELVNKDEVEEIINAGDADREGEIIVRLCISNALNSDKKVTRLWLKDQTEETVKEALKDLKEDKEYDCLANEGFARTYVDWLYGVNLTRYATLKMGTLLRVGRVIIPLIKAIYDRDKSINNFVSDIYYGISSNTIFNEEEIELNSKLKFDKEDINKAKETCTLYNSKEARVVSKSVKKDTLAPGKLYSLSNLQNVLGKKYKMPMDKSLAVIQKLYEEGYVTYPRTNSEYLASNEKDKIKTIINNIKKLGYDIEFKDKKTIFDDSKIESHSALTPTYKIPSKNNLSNDEYLVYSAILKRFVAVFCKSECKIEKSEIKVNLENLEEFILKGNVIIEKGWTKYDEYNKNDKLLPSLNKGDKFSVNFEVKEKKTTPPKHYTIETLNNYLKNPFKEDKKSEEVSEDDSEDYKAIFEGLELGTEATRTGIIENAIKSEYIALKKDVYYILSKGEYLIDSLAKMNISMDKYKTSTLGKGLKRVYRNEATIDEVVELAKEEIKSVFNSERVCLEKDTNIGYYGDEVGVCPMCGNKVNRSRYGYACSNYKECKFNISDSICGRVISKNNVIKMLRDGKSSKIEGFISKKGKKFDAYLVIKDGKVIFEFND